jgi:hypothetical protein
MYYTSSLNKISYITYVTGLEGNVIENDKGMYIFQIEDIKEVKNAADEYDICISLGEELVINLIRYNRVVKAYKNKVQAYKILKQTQKSLDKIDKICDNILEKLEK